MNPLRSHKTLGVVFLCLLLGSVWLTYAVFTKKFADYEKVALESSRVGLNLPARADIKIRGVIVGEVLETDATADGAKLTLGLFPEKVEIIPANVTGSIVPKTLFGEKYVSLIIPEDPAADHITAADTIERTALSTEVEQVLNDLYPLLRAVEPAEVNLTLNAIATALEGRGEQLGQNLETLDAYLKKFNPEIPALVEDLRLLSRFSDTYADVMPQIATILRDTITTTGTLEGREEKLIALFTDVSAFSGTAERFLEANGENLIRLGEVSAEQLRVFARYSPEYPCLLSGIVNAGDLQAEAFRNFTLHIVLETLPNQPRGYSVADKPRFGDKRGPYCGRLPDPPWSQSNPVRHQPNFDDGVDEPTGKGTSRVSPGWSRTGGFVGSLAEARMIKALVAPALGSTAEDVPDLGVLLVGPMARGAEVSYR